MLPFCVIGVAGTARTGAVDDMLTLAHICRENDLWFHVDGSHGAMAILSDEFRTALTGVEFADSLAFELHSWLHVMYDSACVLVRDGGAYSDTYASGASRPRDDDAVRNIGMRHFNPGPERARGFRALGAWFAIKEQGLARLGRNVTRNCYQARYLRHLIDRHPNLELRAPVSLNTVCFRYRMPAMSDAELNTLNSRLVGLIRESGVAVVSQTEIGESLVIRVNITNHRTRSADLKLLVATIDELAPVALSSMVDAADQSPP
jgi:glutamate/tyrosine decarboxylase-like PLP-dependent enzyme